MSSIQLETLQKILQMYHFPFFRLKNRHNKVQPLHSIIYKSRNNLTAVAEHIKTLNKIVSIETAYWIWQMKQRATARPIKFRELETL